MNESRNVYLIDLKEDLTRKFELADTLKYCNIIEYVKMRYDMSVINLAKLFDVKRATIYNYIDGKTAIPQKIMEIICNIYDVDSYEDISKLEYKSNFYRAKLEFMRRGRINPDFSILDLTYIELIQDDKQIKYEVREGIEHRDKWMTALRNVHMLNEFSEKNSNVASMVEYMSKNDNEYNKQLTKLITQTRNNDEKLLMAINQYLSYEASEGNTAIVTTDSKGIQEMIDEILDNNDGVIKVDREDFKDFPKYHVRFKVKSLISLNLIYPKLQIRAETIILFIRSKIDIRLSVIDQILTSIRVEYGKDINYILGSSMFKQKDDELIDLFFI